jgi:O-antigen ligase
LPRAALALAGGGLLAGAGLVFGRRGAGAPHPTLGPLRLPLVAVVVVAVAAAALSISPAASLAGTYGRYESLPMRLAYVGLFCGAAWLGDRERIVPGFLLGCGVAAVETLYQLATGALARPDGNLGQPNLLGALLAMALVLAVDRARLSASPARRAWVALVALYGAALVVSTSRSGWLGALIGICVLVVFAVPARWLRPALAAGGLVVLVAAAVLVLSPLRGLNQDTGSARLGVWRDALSVVAERPVLGWGEETLGLVFGRYQTHDWEPGHNFDRAHSMPLDLAATQGLMGVLACAWLFASWWVGVWQRRAISPGAAGFAGAAAAYLAWSLLNFDWAPATAAFWLLAGAGWSPPDGDGAWRRRGRGKPRPYILATGLALLGLILAVPRVLADMALYAGMPERAVALDPLQARYHATLGTLPELRQAAALGDPDPSAYVALGDAEEQAGNVAAAQAAYRQALERYPYDADARQRLAGGG